MLNKEEIIYLKEQFAFVSFASLDSLLVLFDEDFPSITKIIL